MEHTIKIRGKVRVVKIDKKTGKILEEKEAENALMRFGAIYIKTLAYQGNTTAYGVSPATKLVLLNEYRDVIKPIPGGQYYDSIGTRTININLYWTDSSADAYIAYYMALVRDSDFADYGVDMNNNALHAASIYVNKSPSQTVNYAWYINIDFSAI